LGSLFPLASTGQRLVSFAPRLLAATALPTAIDAAGLTVSAWRRAGRILESGGSCTRGSEFAC